MVFPVTITGKDGPAAQAPGWFAIAGTVYSAVLSGRPNAERPTVRQGDGGADLIRRGIHERNRSAARGDPLGWPPSHTSRPAAAGRIRDKEQSDRASGPRSLPVQRVSSLVGPADHVLETGS